MNVNQRNIPIETLGLFPVLDKLLIEVLRSLKPEEWDARTIAKLWTVKDIAAHLLDGNLRTLSFSRDGHTLEPTAAINTYTDLVAYLNQLNATWVTAAKRLSPQVLTDLLETTGTAFYQHIQTLDPFGKAIFPVGWAGEEESENWFHIAREYTEKFIHQQQIREAVGKQALFNRALFHPFIDTFMRALPYCYRDVAAAAGSIVSVQVLTAIGGEWHIIKTGTGWQFTQDTGKADSTVMIDPETAWKLFSKGISAQEALELVDISGNIALGKPALQMVSVMA